MRKIVILLGMMALAFGAWAQGRYTYSFTIAATTPTTYELLGPHSSYFLINTETQLCYLYWQGPEWKVTAQTTGNMVLNTSVARDGSTSVTWHGTTYRIMQSYSAADESNMFKINPKGEDTREITFHHQFSTDDHQITLKEITGLDNPSEFGGEAVNLKFVMIDPDVGRDAVFDVGYTGRGFVPSFSTAANFGPVPEPTSGVLLLMGVAGLALRRRRMA